MATKTKAKKPVDERAVEQAKTALRDIERRTKRIKQLETELDQEREERNVMVYRASLLQPKAGGFPRVMDLARAMDTRHSFTRRVILGRGHPIPANGRGS